MKSYKSTHFTAYTRKMSLPPAGFTKYTLSITVPMLPYPALGRLRRTCKWMSTSITQTQVDAAVARGMARLGRVELLIQPRRKLFRLSNPMEETIEIWRHDVSSDIFVLKDTGRTLLATSPFSAYTYRHLQGFFAIVEERLDSDESIIWFERGTRYDTRYDRDETYVFHLVKDGDFTWRSLTVFFQELIVL